MTITTHALEALPVDLFVYLMCFLSGFDLLPLSHVNTRYHNELLGPNSDVWTTRAPRTIQIGPFLWRALTKVRWWGLACYDASSPPTVRPSQLRTNAKRRYFESVSMRFPGGIESDSVSRRSAGGIVAPRSVRLDHAWHDVSSFSFDVCFALLPPAPTPEGDHDAVQPVGGVLLGAQSSHWCVFEWPAAIAQIAHVDLLGNLFCSVVSTRDNGETREPLATLQLERWYHLALTFDQSTSCTGSSANEGLQRVYLDGALVSTAHGCLLADLDRLENCQIGSGFMDAGCGGNVRPDYQGAYGFHGLVDEFRFWQGVLTLDDVQLLMQGYERVVMGETVKHVKRTWSLMRNGDMSDFYGDLVAMRSTRPSERRCLHVGSKFKVVATDDRYLLH